jgi:hypothetical protein
MTMQTLRRWWRPYRTHHYQAGFWGVAWGIERHLQTGDFKGSQWFIQTGRTVRVYRRPR